MNSGKVLELTSYESIHRSLLLGAIAGELCLCAFADQWCVAERVARRHSAAMRWTDTAATEAARRALDAYFAGDDSLMSSVPLLIGGSDFSHTVYEELRRIPAGAVATYGAVARRIGRPGAARAVGAACGANTLLLFVPCHRVVAVNGLGGYAGGLERKAALLRHEHDHFQKCK
ncbi:MAG: methylated-DNA--[protein]-cysteine S-methyltransferase [Muribaculaceae bacterium]